MTSMARRIGATLLRSPTLGDAVRAFAGARGHGLVLVYHRLGPSVPGCQIVPSVSVDTFKAHVQALADVVDLVSLDDILIQDRRRLIGRRLRPAVALTFDDDLPSHAEYALPILRERGVTATFFLSGRALHGLDGYWFQDLEALLLAHGERRTAALLRTAESSAGRLMLACERNADLRRRLRHLAEDVPPARVLQRDEIAALSAEGMNVGFHTLAHDTLPDLDNPALEEAVSKGREDLATVVGAPVRYFAYPHGKADTRSAMAVQRAGFSAAFTGMARPVRSDNDRYRLGRWEPGPLPVDDLLVKLAVRLHRAAPAA